MSETHKPVSKRPSDEGTYTTIPDQRKLPPFLQHNHDLVIKINLTKNFKTHRSVMDFNSAFIASVVQWTS